MRRLLCTRRTVALDRSDDYLLAWLAVRNAASAAGIRAWLFRGAAHEDHLLEFLEWDDRFDGPMDLDAVVAALEQLDAFGTAHRDEWEEAT
jgi:hypothetical protein